jgi:excisionase family DNA binding protein
MATMEPQLKLLIDRKEAAARLSISLRTLDTLLASRQLPSKRLGRRVLIHTRDLEKFAAVSHPEIETADTNSANVIS